jgi:hypothetical protein
MLDGAGRVVRSASDLRTSARCMRRIARSSLPASRVVLLIFAIAAGLLSAAAAPAATVTSLLTWPGWEPDKGATVWYWLRHVDKRAEIRVLPAGSTDAAGIFFDTPNATFRRTQSESTFESVLRAHPTDNPAILKLAQLTRDIEINAWRPRRHPESKTLEGEFRRLQQAWPEQDPPIPCVVAFFDEVYEWLDEGGALDASAAAPCGKGRPK